MASVSTLNTGLQGVQTGMNDLKKNAHTIATAPINSKTNGNGSDQITEALINIKLNTQQVAASAKAVRAESDMLGTLIDVRA